MGNEVLALTILIFALLLVPNVQSATLSVCSSGCNSTTIQGAIDLASDGDVVTVSAGTYNESVVIYKPLTLLGAKLNVDSRNSAWGSENLTIINSGSGYNGILINVSNVIVNGFKITESGTDAEIFSLDTTYESAIYVYNEDTVLENIEIIYNWIDDNHGSGIVIRKVNEPIVEYNYISNNGDGVWAAAGIGGQELTGGSFSHNEFFNDISYGLYFGGGKVGSLPANTSGVLISGNNFHHNEKYGLQLYGYYEPWSVSNDGIILSDNDFHDNGRCGIKITDFTNTILTGNRFNGNGANGTSDKYKFGALISAYYTAVGTLFTSNNFSGNELGGIYFLLELEDANLSNIVVNRNNFLDDGLGVKTATRGVYDFPFVINATMNWWGSTTPNVSMFNESISYYPFCIEYMCSCCIDSQLEGFCGGATTDFSSISNWSDVDLVLESADGMVEWPDQIDLQGSTLLFGNYVSIGHNIISVDTSNMPELNHSAELTFMGSGFASTSEFRVYRNGAICPVSICTNVSMSDGNVILEVTQMSSYNLLEFYTSPITGHVPLATGNMLAMLMGAGVIMATLVAGAFASEKMDVRTLVLLFVMMLVGLSLTVTLAGI